MCGIAAVIGAQADNSQAIERMTRRLAHRGPDATGTVNAKGAWLGHRRLSIIDLSGGAQPMADPNERFWIVFNGEIFNFRELRDELRSRGREFRTHSDTEVLLGAYLEFGNKTPERLIGQFAFVIWDNQERTLFAARDRMGEKPLYWATTSDGQLLIASEIKSLLASGLIQPRLDRASIDVYLALLYLPPDRTIYENISTLLPAHAMEWREGKIRQWRYWAPKYSVDVVRDPREAVEEIRRLLQQAVHRQMVADVPVGAFLSGGLDSSTIVAYMTRRSSIPVKTFSVGFEDLINELPYARAVADRYKTDHHELQMSMPLGDLLDRMMDVYDEPFADSSNIPTYIVARHASAFVKVVLSGDGGDELFGGYWWNAARLKEQRMLDNPPRLFPLAVKADALRVLAKLNRRLESRRYEAVSLYEIARALRRKPDLRDRHLAGQSFLDFAQRRTLWGRDDVLPVRALLGGDFVPADSVRGMDRVADFDVRCYLPGDILVKVDRAAMANGLETRAPFLDVDLVEFVLGLPWRMRFSDTRSKPLLHEACEALWPPALRGRSKQGFGGPVKAWIRRPDIRSRFDHATRPGGALANLLPGLAKVAPTASAYRQWSLMCLGLWLEKHAN
ncbi:MAG TPA: asparagine synthase (glutamine-hydrolyzing) [Tepidisphaeraceae bacterium]|jgi:asparagine synthase (glutamine-hydrolysing)|nr:asparagine synthase (glutamine-hydrolyzing) [Tepidisphaeraceae bacterium]